MDKRWDLIIIGGGPAGTSLSILMARAGYEVLLLEKGHYPFQKVCGEYLSREALPYLDELKIPYQELSPPTIDHLRISSSKGSRLESELPLGGIGLSRSELDRMLAERARAEGVEIREGTRVRSVDLIGSAYNVSTRDSKYEANEVVEAFGKDKPPLIPREEGTDKKRGKRGRGQDRWVGIKYSVEGDLPDKRIELHSFPGGYAGLSRVEGERRGCMSYLIDASRLKEVGRKHAEWDLLRVNPSLDERLRSLHFPEKPVGISDLLFGRKALKDEAGWYTGDAAASIPPFAGNGMSMAIEGAFLLAPHLKAHLEGKISEERAKSAYRKDREKLFKTRLRVGNALQRFFTNDGRMDFLIRCMAPFPSLTRSLIRMTHGSGT